MSLKVSKNACSSSNPCSGVGSNVSGCMSNLKNGSVGSNNYKLLSYAADDLEKMYEAMPQDVKNDLKISDSYRPLSVQCNIFDWNYYERTGKRRKKGTSGVPVATPGSSNHGWGRAIDLSAKKAQAWIRDNGHKFGWCWGEVKSEPWHFTYCGEGPNKSPNCSKWCKGPKETVNNTADVVDNKVVDDKKEFSLDLSMDKNNENKPQQTDTKSTQNSVVNTFSDLFKIPETEREDKFKELLNKSFKMFENHGLKKRPSKLNEEIERIRKML